MKYDIFICHASEDKEDFVGPLAEHLRTLQVSVWYDDFSLTVGDRLRSSIDKGLCEARFGLVVLSPAFFAKLWTQYELDGLVQKEHAEKEKVILPIWHNVERDDVQRYSYSLAGRKAIKSKLGLKRVVEEILKAIGPIKAQIEGPCQPSHDWLWRKAKTNVYLADVLFIDKLRGWVVGARGTLLSTTDSGRSWLKHNTKTSVTLNSIAFDGDGRRGCVVGNNGMLLEQN